jgi:hypothetical protein
MGVLTRFKPKGKNQMAKSVPAPTTPIGKWLLDQCNKMIDPNTNQPISPRQASIQAGFKDPASIWRYIYKEQIPDDNSCYRIAEFFSVTPESVLLLAGHLRAPSQKYAEADAALQRKAPELYALLGEFVDTAQEEDIEAFKIILKRLMGKT